MAPASLALVPFRPPEEMVRRCDNIITAYPSRADF